MLRVVILPAKYKPSTGEAITKTVQTLSFYNICNVKFIYFNGSEQIESAHNINECRSKIMEIISSYKRNTYGHDVPFYDDDEDDEITRSLVVHQNSSSDDLCNELTKVLFNHKHNQT